MREPITEEKLTGLKKQANDIRISIIEMLVEAGSGHSAGPLGMADIFTALYFHILKHDPFYPAWPERDRLILSNGHICPVLYATMAHAKYFPVEELLTLRKFGSRLQGHPHRDFLPMLETSSGPLGCGLAQAVGMALAERITLSELAVGSGLQVVSGNAPHPLEAPHSNSHYIFCMMSDGEHDEGNTWEAIMMGGKEKLDNIIAIVDRNHIQIDGNTEDIMPLEPMRAKWEAFNWHVLDIDGHDFKEIINAVEEAKAYKGKPTVIIAHTIPGKGVSFMENKFEWHGKPPTTEEAEVALKELGARS
ncbi:MAG: transketolase [Candidatus Paceibacterota bacterium]|jgi:transketolase